MDRSLYSKQIQDKMAELAKTEETVKTMWLVLSSGLLPYRTVEHYAIHAMRSNDWSRIPEPSFPVFASPELDYLRQTRMLKKKEAERQQPMNVVNAEVVLDITEDEVPPPQLDYAHHAIELQKNEAQRQDTVKVVDERIVGDSIEDEVPQPQEDAVANKLEEHAKVNVAARHSIVETAPSEDTTAPIADTTAETHDMPQFLSLSKCGETVKVFGSVGIPAGDILPGCTSDRTGAHKTDDKNKPVQTHTKTVVGGRGQGKGGQQRNKLTDTVAKFLEKNLATHTHQDEDPKQDSQTIKHLVPNMELLEKSFVEGIVANENSMPILTPEKPQISMAIGRVVTDNPTPTSSKVAGGRVSLSKDMVDEKTPRKRATGGRGKSSDGLRKSTRTCRQQSHVPMETDDKESSVLKDNKLAKSADGSTPKSLELDKFIEGNVKFEPQSSDDDVKAYPTKTYPRNDKNVKDLDDRIQLEKAEQDREQFVIFPEKLMTERDEIFNLARDLFFHLRHDQRSVTLPTASGIPSTAEDFRQFLKHFPNSVGMKEDFRVSALRTLKTLLSRLSDYYNEIRYLRYYYKDELDFLIKKENE